jgi:hypothetical protein
LPSLFVHPSLTFCSFICVLVLHKYFCVGDWGMFFQNNRYTWKTLQMIWSIVGKVILRKNESLSLLLEINSYYCFSYPVIGGPMSLFFSNDWPSEIADQFSHFLSGCVFLYSIMSICPPICACIHPSFLSACKHFI